MACRQTQIISFIPSSCIWIWIHIHRASRFKVRIILNSNIFRRFHYNSFDAIAATQSNGFTNIDSIWSHSGFFQLHQLSRSFYERQFVCYHIIKVGLIAWMIVSDSQCDSLSELACVGDVMGFFIHKRPSAGRMTDWSCDNNCHLRFGENPKQFGHRHCSAAQYRFSTQTCTKCAMDSNEFDV